MASPRHESKSSDLKKVAVIGGTGFIGYHIVNDLLRQGCSVTVVTRNPPEEAPAEWKKNVTFAKINAQKAKPEEFKAVFTDHQGFVYAAGGDPGDEEFHEKNVDAVERIMQGAREAGCDRAVILGSYYTYFACNEECKFGGELRQSHTYVASRIAQAAAARKIGGDAITVAVIEIPWVFGVTPGRVSLWKKLIDWANSSKPLLAPAGGTAAVSVETVAGVAVAALRARSNKNIPVAEGNFTWQQLLNKVGRTSRTVYPVPSSIMRAIGTIYGTFSAVPGLEVRHFLGKVFTQNLFMDLKQCRQKEEELGISHTEGEAMARMEAAFKATIDSCLGSATLKATPAGAGTLTVFTSLGTRPSMGIKLIPRVDSYTEFQKKYTTLQSADEKIAALRSYKLQYPGSPHIRDINQMLLSLQPVATPVASPLAAVEMYSKSALTMGSTSLP